MPHDAMASDLDRQNFAERFRAAFPRVDGAKLQSLERLEAVAWQAHLEGRPAPFRHYEHGRSAQAMTLGRQPKN